MNVMTVLGPVDRQELGIILPHEHCFLDLRNQFTPSTDPEKRKIGGEHVCMHHLGMLRTNPYAIEDNLVLQDFDTAVEELAKATKHGVRTIVDCTSIGIKREPAKLRDLARKTGLNIVAGCGYYTYDTHPAGLETWPIERITDEMLRDMTEGIDGTGIRSGIYGEIGTSDPIRPGELNALRATARAFKKHPAEIQVHTYPWGRAGVEAARLLIDEGVDPRRIVICHLDVELVMDYILDVLKLGAIVEFDNFGREFYVPKAGRGFAGGGFAQDIARVRTIRRLLEKNYERQLLISNDVCLKSLLRAYGGWGYDHVLSNIIPMMHDEGISQATIDNFFVHNPAVALCGQT